MTQAIALTPEDQAVLALESDTIAGHTCKVIVLGEPPVSAAALRDLVAARIEDAPALTRRLADGRRSRLSPASCRTRSRPSSRSTSTASGRCGGWT